MRKTGFMRAAKLGTALVGGTATSAFAQTCPQIYQQLVGEQRTISSLQQELERAAPGEKSALAAQISADNRKEAQLQTEFDNCTALNGQIWPRYMLLSVLYSPPGVGSISSYGGGSTTGSSVSFANTFTQGNSFTLGFPGTSLAEGWSGATQNSSSFQITKTTGFTQSIRSQINTVDHTGDTFLLWVNPQIDVQQSKTDPTYNISILSKGQPQPVNSCYGISVIKSRNTNRPSKERAVPIR